MFRKNPKSQITDYQWEPSDIRKYFQGNFFKLKEESLDKYKKDQLTKDDIFYVLNKDWYDHGFLLKGKDLLKGEEDEYGDTLSTSTEGLSWEEIPDKFPVQFVSCIQYDRDFNKKNTKAFIHPDDFELRKYTSGYFESDGNLFITKRGFNQHNYGKGVSSSEYIMSEVMRINHDYLVAPKFEMGVFVEYPFNVKEIREKIRQVVYLEKPFNILTKQYVIVNDNLYKNPILKYMDNIVGYYDLQSNKLVVLNSGKVSKKLERLYEGP